MQRRITQIHHASCAMLVSLTLAGCGASSSDPSSDSSSTDNDYPSLADTCTNTNSRYPLQVLEISGEVLTSNGDFENADVALGVSSLNSDPMYVYAGTSSAHLVDRAFEADVTQDPINLLLAPSSMAFWIYSVDDEPASYLVQLEGFHYQELNFPEMEGRGYSGVGAGEEGLYTVEPHTWVRVVVEMPYGFGNCDNRLTISKNSSTDSTAEFYLDDIQFSVESF